MRRFFYRVAASFLGVALIVVPSVYGFEFEAVWTGNKATDYSVWPKQTIGWPKPDENTPDPNLPNDNGRIGGSPIIYGEQLICDNEYSAVSRIDTEFFVKTNEDDPAESILFAGGCRESGGQTICDNVDVYDYTADIDDKIVRIDPVFEDADCAMRDERRGPDDTVELKRLICDNVVLPPTCELKDVIGFMPLTQWEGVGEGTLQGAFLPTPPAWPTISHGDFILEMDMAMEDLEEIGGYFYNGPTLQFLVNNQQSDILYVNWGGAGSQYFHYRVLGAGTDYNSDNPEWDPLMEAPGHSNLTLQIKMTGGIVTASYKPPGSGWSVLFSHDMADTPAVELEKGYRLGVVNGGAGGTGLSGNIFWVDEIRVWLSEVRPKPVITLDRTVGDHAGDLRMETYPSYWVERGNPIQDPLWATAEAFLQASIETPPVYEKGDLAEIDITDQMVITAWARRAPDDKVTGENAVKAKEAITAKFEEEWLDFPDDYVIAFNVTDSNGLVADEVRRTVVVFEKGFEWTEYNGHWYLLNSRKLYIDHQAEARAYGGYVVTVNNKEENQFLVDRFLHRVNQTESHQWFWAVLIGYTDLIVNGFYQWDNGSDSTFVNWNPGEPNNVDEGGFLGEEHWGGLAMGPEGWVSPGLWSDFHNDHCCPFAAWSWVPDWTDEDSMWRYRPAWIEVESDPLPPVLNLIGPKRLAIALNADYTDLGVTAHDNVDGDIPFAEVDTVSTLNKNVPGTYLISYSATDAAGNTSSTLERTIDVIWGADETPPVITLGDWPVKIDCEMPCMMPLALGDAYEDRYALYDAHDPLAEVVVKTYLLSAVKNDANEAGSVLFARCEFGPGCLNEIELADSAASGDAAVVYDGTTVSWLILGESEASPHGKLVWQKEDQFPLGNPEAAAAIGTDASGLYVTTYNATDESGNVAPEISRLVHVKDTPPEMTRLGDPTMGILVGEPYEELGVTIWDDEDCRTELDAPIACEDERALENTMFDRLVIGGDEVLVDTPGSYTLTYNVTDSAGNSAPELIRTVTVIQPTASPIQEKAPDEVSDFSEGCFIGTIS